MASDASSVKEIMTTKIKGTIQIRDSRARMILKATFVDVLI